MSQTLFNTQEGQNWNSRQKSLMIMIFYFIWEERQDIIFDYESYGFEYNFYLMIFMSSEYPNKWRNI